MTSPESAGCHRLIREYNATCVTTPDEIAELCDPFVLKAGDRDHDIVADRVLRELRVHPGRTLPELMARTGSAPATLQAQLGRLEALGRVREGGDGWHRVG